MLRVERGSCGFSTRNYAVRVKAPCFSEAHSYELAALPYPLVRMSAMLPHVLRLPLYSSV
jgi:hypothetical protein